MQPSLTPTFHLLIHVLWHNTNILLNLTLNPALFGLDGNPSLRMKRPWLKLALSHYCVRKLPFSSLFERLVLPILKIKQTVVRVEKYASNLNTLLGSHAYKRLSAKKTEFILWLFHHRKKYLLYRTDAFCSSHLLFGFFLSCPWTVLRWCCQATQLNCPGSWPCRWLCHFPPGSSNGSLSLGGERWCFPVDILWTFPATDLRRKHRELETGRVTLDLALSSNCFRRDLWLWLIIAVSYHPSMVPVL